MARDPALLDHALGQPRTRRDDRVVASRALDLANRAGHRHRHGPRPGALLDALEPGAFPRLDLAEVRRSPVLPWPAAGSERGQQILDARLRIAEQGDGDRIGLADLAWIDVQMDQ